MNSSGSPGLQAARLVALWLVIVLAAAKRDVPYVVWMHDQREILGPDLQLAAIAVLSPGIDKKS